MQHGSWVEKLSGGVKCMLLRQLNMVRVVQLKQWGGLNLGFLMTYLKPPGRDLPPGRDVPL